MGTLLVDDKDNTIFESEGIKTPVETYQESKPDFAHVLPGNTDKEPELESEPIIEPITESESPEKNKSNNTVIIMLVVALVIAIGVMIFNNLKDAKEGAE